MLVIQGLSVKMFRNPLRSLLVSCRGLTRALWDIGRSWKFLYLVVYIRKSFRNAPIVGLRTTSKVSRDSGRVFSPDWWWRPAYRGCFLSRYEALSRGMCCRRICMFWMWWVSCELLLPRHVYLLVCFFWFCSSSWSNCSRCVKSESRRDEIFVNASLLSNRCDRGLNLRNWILQSHYKLEQIARP